MSEIVNCLEGCDDNLPEVEFNDECDPVIIASEIEELFIGNANIDPFNDWSQPEEWANRLDQVANTANAIRRLTVVGDKPAATPQNVTASKQREVKVSASHVLNFEIEDLTQKNYDAALKFQCGAQKRVWWKNRGGKILGGNKGILMKIDINPVHGRGDEIMKLVGTGTWKSKQDPDMVDSPI